MSSRACSSVSSSSSRMSCTRAAIVFTGTTAISRAGSNASPPQCAPPTFDGITSGPAPTRRRERSVVAQAADDARHASRISASAPTRCRSEACGLQRRQHAVERLRWRRALPVDVALRTGSFFDWKDRLSRNRDRARRAVRSSSPACTTSMRRPSRVIVASSGGAALSK